MSSSQVIHEQRLEHRLAHVITNQASPHLLLLSQSKCIEQLSLVDVRASSCPVSKAFGWAETGNTSRYLKPSWHHAGNLVACGAFQPVSGDSGIMLWDTRYLSHSKGPLQILEKQTDRRYLRTEFHPSRNLLVALASDGSVSFIDYR